MIDKDKVIFFDTTSRDGKQSPGCGHTPNDTVVLAHQLAKMRVDVMEAGFSISSPDDFSAVKRVAEEVSGIRCCALARALTKDIEVAARSLENAINLPRIHTFIATSEMHMKTKLRMSRSAVIESAVSAVSKAKSYVEDVQFSAEDACRSDPKFLAEVIHEVIIAGARTINIPDTVGYAVGSEMGDIISYLLREVPSISEKGVVLSVHCHNDLEQAVANSLLGLKSGARQVECTINGIGERAGNTHLASVAMALITRRDYFNLNVDINPSEICPTARLVSSIINKQVSDTLPIVGRNVFKHSSGIHQHGMIKGRKTYEIILPEDVGWSGEVFPLTGHSGKTGIAKRLHYIGYETDKELIGRFYGKFIKVAKRKKFVYNNDLHIIMQEIVARHSATMDSWINFVRVDFHKINNQYSATVHLSINENCFEANGEGNGPVASVWDAIKNALQAKKLWPESIELTFFDIGKDDGGVNAVAIANVEISANDNLAYGEGSSTDVVEAYAKAHISAINHLAHAPINKDKMTGS